MKRSSKLTGIILAGVLSLALAGCGNQAQETGENSTVQVESTSKSEKEKDIEESKNSEVSTQSEKQESGSVNAQEKQTEQVAETEQVPETEQTTETNQAPPVELAAGFDEEFVLKPGEVLHIGREGISIAITWIDYDEFGTMFGYCLTIDGKEIYGMGIDGTYVGNQVSQDEFTENRVCCIDACEEESVTLLITAGTVIPEPMVLSGNASDEYVTTKPEYAENENIILFMGEGVKVYGNTLELIEKIIHIAEKESGLYMENDTEFSKLRGNETDWIYGQGVFPGVDVNNDKFHIYVADPGLCSPSAYGHGAVINPQDLEIAEGNGDTILHEVLHCLQMHNGVQMDRFMDEGYATYMTGRICDKDEEMNFNFNATGNYSYYNKEITKENAEEIFVSEVEDEWEYYLYGFRFITYLFETYGDDVFINIMKDATPEGPQPDPYLTSRESVEYIKRNTADTVFEDFAVWLEKNEARFNP